MKKVALIILGTVIAVLLVGLVVVANTTKNVALRSVNGFVEDVTKREELSHIVKTLNGGSVDVSLKSIVENHNGNTKDIFKNSSVSGKIYFSDKEIMLSNFNSKINGTKIAGSAYLSKDVCYVDEYHILGGTYGVEFSSLAENLKESIFAPDSGSTYELDEEVFEKILNALENINDNKKIKKDAKKLLKTVTNDIVDIIFDNAEVKSEKETIRINGKRTSVRQITITIDGDAMQSIIGDVYDYLCESE